MYVIFRGRDIDGYSLQGYKSGAADRGEELEISARVERYEITLGELLRQLLAEVRREAGSDFYGSNTIAGKLSDEQMYALTAQALAQTGFDFGQLDELIYSVSTARRVVYTAFDVTVPAGGSVEVSASLVRDPSQNFGRGEDAGVWAQGYDMVTHLGSALEFTAQYASLSGTEFIELVGNNFGFNLEAGITEVRLDPNEEHYWIQVKPK